MEEKDVKQESPDQQPTPEVSEEAKTIEDLRKKLAETEEELAKVKDLLLRKAAEFENYKKRVENESITIIKFANEELITEILPALDDLERSLKAGKDNQNFETLYRGIELIYQKLQKTLESQGLKAFDTVGKEFDVQYHDALMQTPRADVPPHTVLEEVQKGYTLNGKVIRHAKVIVSSAPQSEEPIVKPDSGSPGDDHQDSATA